jgi:3-deoxy-7-phosphoheptulonate synthase
MGEMVKVFRIHAENGSRLGGVHLELTGASPSSPPPGRGLADVAACAGDDVTECTGGSAGLDPTNLSTNYQSFCDPRLNYTQSLDMAFCIANELKNVKNSSSSSRQ